MAAHRPLQRRIRGGARRTGRIPGRRLAVVVATLLGCLAGPVAATDPEPTSLDALARELVEAFQRGDAETLRSRVGPGFTYREIGGSRGDFDDLLRVMGENLANNAEAFWTIDWVGTADQRVDRRADVRGAWWFRRIGTEDRRRLEYSIQLGFDPENRVVRWTEHFRRRLWTPTLGDERVLSEHFVVQYWGDELEERTARHLSDLAEHWYRETSVYLGKTFHAGFRLLLDVAGCHEIPYASAPGDDAFILVGTEHARHDYGFSLVHELTHNLMGHSRWMTETRGSEELPAGNRLLDEGFAVVVEETLQPAGRVYPNFGTEVHAAYRALLDELGGDVPPVVDAERLRSHSRDPRLRRLGYLQQASFVKHLVESRGLDAFLRFFEEGPESTEEIYGVEFAALEGEWRAALDLPDAG